MKLGKILKGLSLILIIGIVLVVVIGVFMESKLPAQEESNSLTLRGEDSLSQDEPPSTLLIIIPEKDQRGDFIELTGRIYSMGSPPVIQLGVETLDGEVYGIVGERTKELWKFRDKILHLEGYLAGRTPRTEKSIEVINYEVLMEE